MPQPDPVALPPLNAWLVYANSACAPAPGVGIEWSVARQTQPGDLVYGYFVEPHCAVRFVARAASHAWYEQRSEGHRPVRSTSWWALLTPPLWIPPVPVTVLRDAVGGPLPMRGRSGRYLPPAAVQRLNARIGRAGETSVALEAILRPTTAGALPELRGPVALDMPSWRALAGGLLRCESHVRSHVVEPLLGWALAGETTLRLAQGHPIGATKEADYVVLRDGVPRCVVQVKLRLRRGRDGGWPHSLDVTEATGYAATLGTGAVLVDAFDVHLIAAGAQDPFHSFTRARASARDIDVLRGQLAGRAPALALARVPGAPVLVSA